MPTKTFIEGRYQETWEKVFEEQGPIREEVFPPEHQCPYPSRNEHAERAPNVGGLSYLWDVVEKAAEGKKAVIDMGGSKENYFPGAISWDLETGHDIRDVESLRKSGTKFDLIISCHSIEHIRSSDFGPTVMGWIEILEKDGEMLFVAPHRCSREWSACLPDATKGLRRVHLWCPTCACVGNFLVDHGLTIIDYDTHCCKENAWWLRVKKC